MDVASLAAAVVVDNGLVRLSADTLPESGLGRLLLDYGGGAAIEIRGAAVAQSADGVTVTGTASYLGLADAPVRAMLRVDGTGRPQAAITLTAGRQGGSSLWSFRRTFPNLPPSALDQQTLDGVVLTLTTEGAAGATTETGRGAGLIVTGTVASVAIDGAAGPFAVAAGRPFTAWAVRETAFELTPVPPFESWPWDPVPWAVPGIHQSVPLGSGFSLGPVALSDPALRLYSPVTAGWLRRHPPYAPVTAATADLHIGTQGGVIALAALLDGSGELVLTGRPDDVTLGSLAELAHLTGGADVVSALPDPLRGAVQAARSPHLLRLALTIAGATSGAPDLRLVTVTLGYPDLAWQITGALGVREIAVEFGVSAPLGAGRRFGATVLGAMEIGGVELDVQASLPDFSVRAELPEGATLPLADLFARCLPELPAPPGLHCGALEMAVGPHDAFSVTASLADEPGWTLDLGAVRLTLEDVWVEIERQAGAKATGAFTGAIVLSDEAELELAWDVPGAMQLRGELPALHLSALWGLLAQAGLPAPAGFDVELRNGLVSIEREDGAYSFNASALATGLGEIAFAVRKTGQETGAAVGIALETANAPGLGVVRTFLQAIDLQRMLLVLSSLDDPGFAFPDVAQFSAPAFPAKGIKLPGQAQGLAKGFNLYAVLGTSSDRGLGALLKLFGLSANGADGSVAITLAVSLPRPEAGSRLFLALHESAAGLRFDGTMGLVMADGLIGGFLNGQAKTNLQGAGVTFSVRAAVYETGVLISGTMEGTLSAGPITLENVALALGVDMAGLPSLGFAAEIQVDRFHSSLAIFLNSLNPAQSMLAGAMSGVTLLDIAEVIAGQGNIPGGLSDLFGSVGLKGLAGFDANAAGIAGLAGALDRHDHAAVANALNPHGLNLGAGVDGFHIFVAEPGRRWFIAHRGKDGDGRPLPHYELASADGRTVSVRLEPQLYIAPQPTRIGDLTFPQGAYVAAGIDEPLIKIKLEINIDTTRPGISADAEIEPIVLLGGDLLRITSLDGSAGPRLSLATFSRDDVSDPALREPHLAVTGAMRLLGLSGGGAMFSLTTAGLAFAFEQSRALLELALNGVIDRHDPGAMHAGGRAAVGFDRTVDAGPLGSLHVQTSIAGDLGILLADSKPTITFRGGFGFMGLSFDIPEVSLAFAPDLLVDLAKPLEAAVGNAIGGQLKIMLGVAGGAAKIAGLLAEHLGMAAKDVAPLLAHAGATAGDLADALKGVYNLNPEQVARALLAAGLSVLDVTVGLKAGLALSADVVTLALGASGVALDTIAGALHDGLHLTAEEIGTLFNDIGLPGDAIAHVLTTVFDWPSDKVAVFLKEGLGYSGDAARTALDGVNISTDALAHVFDTVIDGLRASFDPTRW